LLYFAHRGDSNKFAFTFCYCLKVLEKAPTFAISKDGKAITIKEQ